MSKSIIEELIQNERI